MAKRKLPAPKPQKVYTPSQPADFGTPELAARCDLRMEKAGTGRRVRNITQVPLDYYLNKGAITQRQYDAGEQLYADFARSGIEGNITSNLKPHIDSAGTPDEHIMDKQARARERYHRAIKSVGGLIGQRIVRDVCCFGYLLKDIDVPNYKNSSQMAARFREGLDDLAEHYRLPE